MRKVTTVLLSTLLLLAVGCRNKNTKTQDSMSNISKTTVDKTVKQLSEQYPEQSSRIERSIPQAAALWQTTDGSEEEFKEIKLTIEDFGGFDENWCEKDRDFEDPKGVEGVLEWLESKADSIDDEWCTEYHIGDITVRVDYTSYSI